MDEKEKLEQLQALIEKSNLIEVEATRVDYDGCGKPVIVNSGTMLVHKDHVVREEEKTKMLRDVANMARKICELEREIKSIKR